MREHLQRSSIMLMEICCFQSQRTTSLPSGLATMERGWERLKDIRVLSGTWMYLVIFILKTNEPVDSTRLLTASADNSLRMWAVETGKELFRWDTKTAVRSVHFGEGDRIALFVTDKTMGQPSTIHVVSIAEDTTKRKQF
jgi:hypothetical protein